MNGNFNENAGVLPIDSNVPAVAGGTRAQVGAKARLLGIGSMGILLAGIAVLGWLSFFLAATRIYQVDECLNVFVSRMIAARQSAPGMDLFQLLLSLFMPAGARAADIFASARLFTWLIFWLNFILIALATGERIFSRRWLIALVGAATLAPLWDYGFEIRHDILLLAGVLFIWGMVRFHPPRLGTFFCVGACSVALIFISIKSILFTVPICVGIFLFPPPGARPARWKLATAGCLGAVLAFFALRLVFKAAGLGHDYMATVQNVASVPSDTFRFWPTSMTLPRLLVQTPLLMALVFSAIIACAAAVLRDKRAALNWDGLLPETLLLGIALTALFINPNPYPYNLLHVAPYAFLLAYRYGLVLWKQYSRHAAFATVAVCVIVFTHLVPFVSVTHRHWSKLNFGQERLMSLTEDLTDPQKDTVFDGIGMVPTRKVCDMRTFIHGQQFLNLVKNSPGGMNIRNFLAANPPSVVILSYRTEWFSDEDRDFLQERYVSIDDDFMVLGSQLPAGGGTFQVYHAGRYRITSAEGSNIVGTYDEPKRIKDLFAPQRDVPPLVGTIDGIPLNDKPVELSVGMHRIECSADTKAAVVWVGPHLDKMPRAPGQNRHTLFENWY